MAKYKYEILVYPPGWKPEPVLGPDLPSRLTIIEEDYYDVVQTVHDLLGQPERTLPDTNEGSDLPEPEWTIFVCSVEEVADDD